MTSKEQNENGSPGPEPSHSNVYLLQKAALKVRHAGGHAAITIAQQKLWIFGVNESQLHKSQISLESYINSNELLMVKNAQTMKCFWSGEFKAIHLLAAIASHLNSSQATGIDTIGSRKRSTDVSGAPTQAFVTGANAPDLGVPLNEVYKVLVEALALSVSYYMTRDCLLVPINFRTFAPRNSHQAELPKINGVGYPTGYSSLFVDMEIELTADGMLLISIKHNPQIHMKQITTPGLAIASITNAKTLPLVRVAPSGRVFQFIGQTVNQTRRTENSVHSKNTAIKPEDAGYLRGNPWRQQVTEWLGSVGLRLPDLNEESFWALIATPPIGSEAIENQNTRNGRSGNLIMEWPMMLCFEFNVGILSKTRPSMFAQDATTNISKDFGIEWFQSTGQEGYLDPLNFVLRFLKDQESRDLEIKSLQSRTTPGTAHDSPANTTLAHGQETVLATAIYPTPPDALPSGITPGSSTLEFASVIIPNSNPVTVLGDFNPPEALVTRKPQVDNILGEIPEEDTVEDRFDNADDDLFESNGITEADFNFFDEPEMDIDSPIILQTSGPELTNAQKTNGLDKPNALTTIEPARLDGSLTRNLNDSMIDSPSVEQRVDQMEIVDSPERKSLAEGKPKRPSMIRLPVTPPLNPHSIREVLKMQYLSMKSPKTMKFPQTKIPDTAWDQVKFHSNVGISDSKYMKEGRFGFNSGNHSFKEKTNRSSITNGKLGNAQSPSNPSSYIDTTGHKFGQSRASLALSHGQVRDLSPLSDDEQDTDVSKNIVNPPANNSTMVPNSKRRKYLPLAPSETTKNSQGFIQATTKEDTMVNEIERKASFSTRKAELLLAHLVVPSSSNWSLTALPAPKERLRDNAVSSAPALADYIEIAQIVASQAATTSVQLSPYLLEQNKPTDSSVIHAQDQYIIDILKRSFMEHSDFIQQTVLSNAEIREEKQEVSVPTKAQLKPTTRRLKISDSGDADVSLASTQYIFPISASRICVQKTDSLWELLPSAFTFWETLGLGPVNGQKEVNVYCVYPQSRGIQSPVRRFLDTMRSAWESCRLGNHTFGAQSDGVSDGLIPVTIEGVVTQQSAIFATKKACELLGTQLGKAALETRWCNVIYLVNPFSTEIALRGLCACFYALLKAYDRHATTEIPVKNRPVLQIIPMSLIASFEKLVFLEPQVAINLAREVYDRCPSYTTAYTADLPITSAASTTLAEPIPWNFYFQLSADPPSDLMHERAYINVAYCVSPDERWITVAWTDALGKYQHTACYNNGGDMTFGLIAQEIWDSTLYYINPRKVIWQIFIAKVGVLELSEKAIWQRLAAATPQPRFSINMVIVSVNTSPMLTIYPGRETQLQSPSTMNPAHNLPVTPITTPQAQPFSPGPNPLTGVDGPGFTDIDPTARLLDITDESWGIVLGRRRNVSRSLVDYNPALASGYLVKRTGPGDFDQAVVMEVNVFDYFEPPDFESVLEPRKPETEAVRRKRAESMLREVLIMYRGLALLAKMRGMEDMSSCIPWHVSAVIKAERALRYSM